MTQNWFILWLPTHLPTKLPFNDEDMSLDEMAEKADLLLITEKLAFAPQVTEFCEQRQHNNRVKSSER